MRRFIIEDLIKWKESKRRKPLILRGARQVGKTWILEEFGKEFSDGFVRINFDKEPEYNQFFEKSKENSGIPAFTTTGYSLSLSSLSKAFLYFSPSSEAIKS